MTNNLPIDRSPAGIAKAAAEAAAKAALMPPVNREAAAQMNAAQTAAYRHQEVGS